MRPAGGGALAGRILLRFLKTNRGAGKGVNAVGDETKPLAEVFSAAVVKWGEVW